MLQLPKFIHELENMKAEIVSVKGTRDFYPEDMAVRTWLYQMIREVSESYGYQEWDGPFLEKIDLYAAKSGEELVKEQAFVFADRGGDYVTLRPELTPTLARMVAQRQRAMTYPLRWWSFGPFWRYERPQRGRTREFFQWNIDFIGATTPESDAELVAICAAFFRKVGLRPDQVKIFINNRRLMDTELAKLGIDEEIRPAVFRLIDRRGKMASDEWERIALEAGITEAQLDGLKTLLSDDQLWKHSSELQRLFDALDLLGLGDYIQYDSSVIRGLDYYTGTVFEAKDLDGGRAILGGGRYDNLVSDVGGDQLPGVGFAMGDVMMGIVLKKYDVIPSFKKVPADVFVTVFDDGSMGDSLELSAALRQKDINVICASETAKLPKQLKFANRMGIRLVVIAGPDEIANQEVAIKDLAERTQIVVARKEFAQKIMQLLAEE
jgi:histidyl-tRNA synthetase